LEFKNFYVLRLWAGSNQSFLDWAENEESWASRVGLC